MSTRATVCLKKASAKEEAYLYHHCDGYALDEDLDDVLKNLPNGAWNVKDLVERIIDYDDVYGHHCVTSVGWDSEYVYVIDLDERTLKKYGCGICVKDGMSIEEEKTQDKYLERTIKYPTLSEAEEDARINAFVAAIKTIVETTAGVANLNDSMKLEAVKRLYKLYDANKGLQQE